MRETTRDDELTLPEWQRLNTERQGVASLPCAAPERSQLWTSDDLRDHRLAATLCASCAVLTACKAFAIAADLKTNVWGGTTPAERRRGRRANKAA